MGVYGEEHHVVDISNGLWLSPAPDSIPAGFCQTLVNFIKSPRETWVARKGMRMFWSLAGANVLAQLNQTNQTNIPEIQPVYYKFGELNGGPQLPQFWISRVNAANTIGTITTNTGKRGAADTRDYNDQDITAAIGANAFADMCQYKDRIYGALVTSTSTVSIYTVSGWIYDATSPALTAPLLNAVTTVTVGVGAPDPVLFIYHDRAWIGRGNRLTFTDIPLSGLYPDVWNAGANFINLPSSGIGSPQIYNCIPLNGLLYIFTDKGIFALNGRNADPTAWSVEFITNSVCITNKHAVAVVNGLFIITDRQKLVSFNGAAVHDIGKAVEFMFNIYNSFSIVPFLKGFLFCCRGFGVSGSSWIYATPPGASSIYWSQSRSFYYDGSVWSEFAISQVGTIGPHFDPYFGAVQKQVSNSTQENVSYLLGWDNLNSLHAMYYYDYTLRTDVTSALPRAMPLTLKTKDVIPAAFVYRQRLAKGQSGITKVKYGFLHIFTLYAALSVSFFKNGQLAASSVAILTLPDLNDHNYEIKIAGPEYASRVSVQIDCTTANIPTMFSNTFPSNVPFVEIKTIVLVVDTDKRQEPDTFTT